MGKRYDDRGLTVGFLALISFVIVEMKVARPLFPIFCLKLINTFFNITWPLLRLVLRPTAMYFYRLISTKRAGLGSL